MTAVALTRAPTWRDLLDRQDAVLSRHQALRSGLSEDAWQWRLDTGRWQRLLPGVAAAHSGGVSRRQQVWAAVLYAGAGAALSGDAALVEHGLRLPDLAVIDVAVPTGRRVAAQRLAAADGPGVPVRMHQVARLADLLLPVRRPRLTVVAAAVLHAMAWAASDRSAEWRMAAAVQQRLVTPPALRQALAALPHLPRHGLAQQVLDDVELGAHAAGELAFLALLRRAGLPVPDRLQCPVRSASLRYLDAWWELQRVAVEVDGAHHRFVGQWDVDVLRANALAVDARDDRVVLLRYTRANLRHDTAQVLAQLTAVLL